MCGIAGWFGEPLLPEAVTTYCKKLIIELEHRGPDNQAYWIDDFYRCFLCHTRLAIINPAPSGHQPMLCVDGRWVISFNGEIYNYRELRDILSQKGYVFKSNTDTEVFAASFDHWGVEAFTKFRGMYSAALWNRIHKVGYLVRDPFGIKPLYIKETSRGVYFSSELRPLIRIFNEYGQLNFTALAAFLATGSVPEPLTIITGIRMLEPGSVLRVENGQVSKIAKLDLDLEYTKQDDPISAAPKLRQSIIESVDLHLVSDVPVGLFLSGGIDSTCLAACLKVLQRNDVTCFTLSFFEECYDESTTAQKTANFFGLNILVDRIHEQQAINFFDEYINNQDQPSIDGFNTYLVSRFAASHGYRVVLSGLGGDELFGGYRSFKLLPIITNLVNKIQPYNQLLSRFLAISRHHKLMRVADSIKSGGLFGPVYRSFRGIFSESEIAKIMSIFKTVTTFSYWKSFTDYEPVSKHPLVKISELEIKKFMLNQLLRDSDVMSMANHIELRVPYLEKELFKVISNIPPDVRYQPNKGILLSAFPEIPEWVYRKRKKGFVVPIREWMNGKFGKKQSWISRHTGIKVDCWYRFLALLSLEHWIEKNIGMSACEI